MPDYVYGMIAGVVCILIGMLIGSLLHRKSKQQPGTVSPPAPDVVKIYEACKEAVKDDMSREDTINKLKERLGL